MKFTDHNPKYTERKREREKDNRREMVQKKMPRCPVECKQSLSALCLNDYEFPLKSFHTTVKQQFEARRAEPNSELSVPL